MIAYYHRADLDGICSGAIIKSVFPTIKLIGLDYGDDYDAKVFSHKFTNRTIYFLDVTLQPRHLMLELEKAGNQVVIIDHHITSINDIKELGWNPDGVLDTSKAGCELTWEYFYPNTKMPTAVHWLGRYDVWDKSEPNSEIFQYGMKVRDLKVDSPEWHTLLFGSDFHDDDDGYKLVESILDNGFIVRQWNSVKNKKIASTSAREVIFEGLVAVVINGYDGSPLFDSVYKEEEHDIMISYIQRSDGTWSYGLYSDKPEVHCGELARKYNGGGHAGAAGFNLKDLIL